jgi:dTDP-4-dehydrorhamnose 3,5-epimerase-like enzyme
MPEAAIEGVEIKELVTHADERGFFREIPRDEGRIPHDDASIGYDWTAGPEIK